jgi:cytochrome P450
MMEMQIIVPMLVRAFRLDLVPGARVAPNPVVTLRLKHGLPMTAHAAA